MSIFEVTFNNGALVTVVVDESIFTQEFLEDWNSVFYPLDMMGHIRLLATRAITPLATHNWEGYGRVFSIGNSIYVEIIEGDGAMLGLARVTVSHVGDNAIGAQVRKV